MDRRRLLYGMAGTGIAAQLNLPKLAAQSVNAAHQSRKSAIFYHPDLELNQPHGPVKMCVEETTGSDGTVMTQITEYSRDGRMVSSRSERDGRVIFDTNDHANKEVRDADGRLIKSTTKNRDSELYEYNYTYDQAGRMLTTTNTDNSDRVEYRYGPDGLMTSTHTFDSKTIEKNRQSAFAGSAWEAAIGGFGVPVGGTVQVNYDKNDSGTEMRVLTADGQTVTHTVRKSDSDGRLLEEKTLEQHRGVLFLEQMSAEQPAQLTPEQIQGFAEQLNALEPKNAGAKYFYDSEGRLTKMQERNFGFEHTKTRVYNERGDKIEEREEFRENAATSPNNRDGLHLPEGSVTKYAYKYDSYGNWIERVMTWGDRTSSSTTRRTLTYY